MAFAHYLFWSLCVTIITVLGTIVRVNLPSSGMITTTIQIQEITNSTKNFTQTFIIPAGGASCLNPKVSITFREINFALSREALAFRYGGTSLVKCSSDRDEECDSIATCLNDYLLDGLIEAGENATFLMQSTADLDPLCAAQGIPYTIDANLSLTCQAVDYHANIDLDSQGDGQSIITVIEDESSNGQPQLFNVTFHLPSSSQSCLYPWVSMDYFSMDNDSPTEHLRLIYDGTIIEECKAKKGQCSNTWVTCVPYYVLQSVLLPGEKITVVLEVSNTVGSICGTGYAVESNIALVCGTTLYPTASPTYPSTEPTTYPTADPTQVPTADYTVVANTNLRFPVKTKVEIKEYATSDSSIGYYYVLLDVPLSEKTCHYPSVDMSFENIDFKNASTQYLTLSTLYSTKTCSTGQDSQCGQFVDCMTNHPLGVDKVDRGDSLLLTLQVGPNVQAQCAPNNPYAVVVNLTFNCHPLADYEAEVELNSSIASPQSQSTTITIIEGESSNGNAQFFRLAFRVPSTSAISCYNPLVSMRYFAMDNDSPTETLTLYYDGNVMATCYGGNQCTNQYFNCIEHHILGISQLSPGQSIYFTMEASATISSICSTGYAVESDVTLTCGTTLSPTPDPTNSPTQFPTFDYVVSVNTDPILESSTTVQVLEYASADNTIEYYYVSFQVPLNGDICYNPSVDMIYEEIDFSNSAGEYLALYYDTTLLNTCSTGRDFQCGNFVDCLTDHPLGVAQFNPGDTFALVLEVGPQNDAICIGAGNPYAVVTNITVNCVSSSDYYVILDPQLNSISYATAHVTEYESTTNSIMYFSILFTVPNTANACYNPKLTMIYEEIDYNHLNSEYLQLSYNGSVVASKCSSGVQNGCGSFASCFVLESLSMGQLNPGDFVQFQLEVGSSVDDLCAPANPYAVVSNITLSCHDISVDYSAQLLQIETQIQVQELPSPTNTIIIKTIEFVSEVECINPTVSMIYEEIDYSSPVVEWVALHYDGSSLAQCASGRDRACGQWANCLSDVSFGKNVIRVGESVVFQVKIGPMVDALCKKQHPYATNAIVTLSCASI